MLGEGACWTGATYCRMTVCRTSAAALHFGSADAASPETGRRCAGRALTRRQATRDVKKAPYGARAGASQIQFDSRTAVPIADPTSKCLS
jgi:hypothetical protein